VTGPPALRVVTLNLWNEQGPHEARLRLVAERLRALSPDVIALQEVRRRDGIGNQAEILARALSAHHVYARAAEWGGGEEGLAILSRLPILLSAAEPLVAPGEGRAVLGARLQGPAGEVCAVTTHLSYRLWDGLWRERQVVAVDAFCRRFAGDALAVLCGDFNAVPDCDEIRFLRGRATLAGRRTYWQDAFARDNAGADGLTWAARNPYTAALLHLEPDRRIDYVFVSPVRRDGTATVLEARVVLDEPDATGVWPSDHFAVLAVVQTAPSTP
jgi:endonuclease/exonuclease/phosphatase family metal-dependent hydrolase